jgi:radical SAM protein with 4Fe4S-binding SPASM domain
MSRPAPFFIYRPPEGAGAPETGGIILSAHERRWCAANQTTLRIAQGLAEGLSMDEIAADLAGRFDLPGETAKGDVRYVADYLTEHRFLPGTAPCRIRSPALQSVYLHLTARCNLACPHCYVAGGAQEDLPASLVLRTIDELREIGGDSVTLSGGEPLLHPEIRRILRYAALRVQVQILSNGTLIDEDWAAFLAGEVHPAIQISLDGSRKEIHDPIRGLGNFTRTLKAVELLQEAGLAGQISFATTIMQPNRHDIKDIIGLAQALGVPRVRFLPLRRIGRAEERWDTVGQGLRLNDYEEFFDYAAGLAGLSRPSLEVSCGLSGFLLEMPEAGSADDFWCPVGRQLTIGIDGEVFPCVLMMRQEFSLGNAFQASLAAMMRSETMVRTVKALAERREKIEKCAACPWRNLCQAGCMGQALDGAGTVWDPDLFCDYRQQAYRQAFHKILADFGRPRP